jgi:hypothetical protein
VATEVNDAEAQEEMVEDEGEAGVSRVVRWVREEFPHRFWWSSLDVFFHDHRCIQLYISKLRSWQVMHRAHSTMVYSGPCL